MRQNLKLKPEIPEFSGSIMTFITARRKMAVKELQTLLKKKQSLHSKIKFIL
jgi:hypothetical protein